MVTKIIVRDGGSVLPNDIRVRFGIEDGAILLAEAGEDGILLRPDDAAIVDGYEVEMYTPERKAEFFLNNAMDTEDYRWARAEVQRMGLNPDDIPHDPIVG